MATVSPSIGVIRALVRAIRNKASGTARVFGIFAPGRWTGPVISGAGSEEIAIYQCDSPLQIRLALQKAAKSEKATVIVTPLDQGKISDDILLRLASRKLHPINSWEIIRSLFKAKLLDPRITRYPCLADILLDQVANGQFQPVAGGLLDAETVWGILLPGQLGLTGARPDMVELLRATAESNLADRWRACSREFRTAAMAWITDAAGDAAQTVLTCVEGEHGAKALSIGLVMGVVYHEAVGRDLDRAAGRLESHVGTTHLSSDIARRWRDASAVAVRQLTKTGLRRCMDETEIILENIGVTDHAWRSDEIESGFEQRLSRFGLALTGHVDSRASAISDELQVIYKDVLKHRLANEGGRRLERCEMAIRLARWLADQNGRSAATTSSLRSMAQDYAKQGGFVDWARQVLRGGEPNQKLAAALVRLVDRTTELREEENKRFGRALVEERAGSGAPSGLIPVEQILDQVVCKAAEEARVLLLVADGMSWAVFRELMADITSRDWNELGIESAPDRLIGLTALPSVTEVCRTSLFCGTLKRGKALDETQGFGSHPRLCISSQPGFAPKLFHKAALEGDDDSSLAGDIRQALADKRQRVVGIVINAVDDHLDKGDQIDATWTTERIRVLQPILAEAQAADRLVVLLSDHGHIVDRQTQSRESIDGQRWRRPGGEVASGELEITSPRVLLPEQGHVIIPWSEKLRYGSKRNGYHGGGTPQEMLIPIGILWAKEKPPEGFTELSPDLPSWWTEPTVIQPLQIAVETPARTGKQKSETPTLFDQPKPTAKVELLHETWIGALVKSEVFANQKKLAGRAPLDEGLLYRFLSALASRGGSMTTPALASAIGIAEHRLPGLIAVIQRHLNVEGYAILDRQDQANTVALNVVLLKKQFELSM